MLASSVLLISGLVAGAHGALMPRQSSTTAATGCWWCPTGHIDELATYAQIGADGSLLCTYVTSTGDNLQCTFDETGTPIAPSDTGCGGAPATLGLFQCPFLAGAPLASFLYSHGYLQCTFVHPLNPELGCLYNLIGDLGYDPDGLCPTIALSCVSTTRRSYMADNNFAAVKRRQAARAAAPITLTSRRLTPDNKK